MFSLGLRWEATRGKRLSMDGARERHVGEQEIGNDGEAVLVRLDWLGRIETRSK